MFCIHINGIEEGSMAITEFLLQQLLNHCSLRYPSVVGHQCSRASGQSRGAESGERYASGRSWQARDSRAALHSICSRNFQESRSRHLPIIHPAAQGPSAAWETAAAIGHHLPTRPGAPFLPTYQLACKYRVSNPTPYLE